ncbi:leucyl/phenylalanyl-tRNA--protein transferase [Helicobacter saguini]|uniref:Leucyl/phenylalanyl-tRNA--protein transferase n=1 Tax=Helicobacter saguini TaxID=1548018 RepID=A0A347VPE2_9HELI|nr:leucyl/phenylalanyl-tRNA--protein transferase [Helicobacter saguini]MWV61401.1 leucyl/phenylalanyl-tRNA--protein transferase [Helicobacter saguini]MWV67931.1 leucyl/phenylalanyl-tRNA--protein transferase [Helicobacter saguini]MWV70602.1 leucyl/phenylalanyl-tRNA--protein transferase [Helicobacter saguini]MWV72506.1 leucyl/phenylalanyl-tRNA--protein transferase [Helicobacter saguini]TLD94750.1 leucyl/phenylalanyl-tRNA--protein transferase [Helicobacter saguini]
MIRLLDESLYFPSPFNVDGFRPLALGGDLSVERLLLAYSNGIFPWQDSPIVWYSPNPRAILELNDFRLTKSLKKSIKNKNFSLKIDTNFALVMQNCKEIKRKNENSTWISDYFIESYTRLHKLGLGHSFEIYQGGELVGGLYGVSLGGVFMGESMFAKVSDASKVAFFYLVEFCKAHNFDFIDAQVQNPHLQSLGVKEISKIEYLSRLESSLKKPTLQGKWRL